MNVPSPVDQTADIPPTTLRRKTPLPVNTASSIDIQSGSEENNEDESQSDLCDASDADSVQSNSNMS